MLSQGIRGEAISSGLKWPLVEMDWHRRLIDGDLDQLGRREIELPYKILIWRPSNVQMCNHRLRTPKSEDDAGRSSLPGGRDDRRGPLIAYARTSIISPNAGGRRELALCTSQPGTMPIPMPRKMNT